MGFRKNTSSNLQKHSQACRYDCRVKPPAFLTLSLYIYLQCSVLQGDEGWGWNPWWSAHLAHIRPWRTPSVTHNTQMTHVKCFLNTMGLSIQSEGSDLQDKTCQPHPRKHWVLSPTSLGCFPPSRTSLLPGASGPASGLG